MSSSKDGFQNFCKECQKEHFKDYYSKNKVKLSNYKKKNKEKLTVYEKKYRAENKEKLKSSRKEQWARKSEYHKKQRSTPAYKKKMQKYRSNNRVKISKQQKEWQNSNRGKVNSLNSKRRAKRLNASPLWADKESIDSMYALSSFLSFATFGDGYHVDHIVPLQGSMVSGLHIAKNLRIIPALENLSKGSSFFQ